MRTNKYWVIIDGYIEKETDLAVLIENEWHPKSVFDESESDLTEGTSGEFKIARWYAQEKDLNYINQEL